MNYLTIRAGLCSLMGFVIVFITRWQFNDFFFIDDAQNVFLPFIREMGHIWLSGHIPVLTTNTFWGGNILVDMQTSPFAPQTILTSLFAVKSNSFSLTANFYAWLNISLVIMGSYWLGRVLDIRISYSYLLGFIVATNQVFIYVFCASWWNYAGAFAWFVVSFAALLNFRQNSTIPSFIYALLSLCCLFASAGTQMQLAYLVLFIIVLIFDYLQFQNMRRLLSFSLIGLGAFLMVAIPLISEYVYDKPWIERGSAYNNYGNFLVPSWGYVINFFNPFYHAYIHWFGGFQHIPVAIGYVSILALLPIFFSKPKHNLPVTLKILFTATAASLILVFSSSQLGATRWPFRYLPVSGLLVATIVIYFIDKSVIHFSTTRLRYYSWSMGFFALIQLFSAEASVFEWDNLLYTGYFIGLCTLLILPFYKQQSRADYPFLALCFTSFLAWVGTLSYCPTLAITQLSYPRITQNISGNFPKQGYIIDLAPMVRLEGKDISDLHSAQYLLFDAKSINGYSPVGHIGIQHLFPANTAHGYFKPPEALVNIGRHASEGIKDAFQYQLMNINTVFAHKNDISPNIARLLKTAGLKIKPYPITDKRLITPVHQKHPEGSLTYQTIPGSITLDHNDGMTHEWFNVNSSASPRTLVFSRVYWPGYHAKLNNTEYPVEHYEYTLVKLELPANASGKLELYYEPVTWQYTRWSILTGLLLTGAALRLIKPNLANPKHVSSSV